MNEFKHFGIAFSGSGCFCNAQKHLMDQVHNTTGGIIRKSRKFNLPLKHQLDLFDRVDMSIIFIGSD